MSWSWSELRVRLAPWNQYKPSSKLFLLTVLRRYFCCGSVVSCVCHAPRLFIAALWSPAAEKRLTSWLLFVMFIVFVLLSRVVSWVRCGTWLYRFLIFAGFPTRYLNDLLNIEYPCNISKGSRPFGMLNWIKTSDVWYMFSDDNNVTMCI